ncbi:Hypothetical predicted protein [Cloeon dipterum]|uniref:C-type lectin domain-containing protein n=1 Tax=Cloeon dipterum TaxID=197152 RepID=A0A8S1E4X7_9INSE|nr:Hypothetical predicted protein [Cloeon dipterum]
MNPMKITFLWILVSLVPYFDCKKVSDKKVERPRPFRRKVIKDQGQIRIIGPLNRKIINIKTVVLRNTQRAHIIKCCGQRKCSKSNFNRSKNKTSSLDGWRNKYNSPSYKKVKIGSKKYKFPFEKATFENAKKICQKDQMDIASLDNPTEVAGISNYLQYIGISDDPVFSSISSLLGGGGASSLLNWATESPPGGQGDCLVQQEGLFFNASCDTKRNFICEDPKKEDKSDSGLDTLTSIEDAVLNFVNGKNIVIPDNRATIPEAKSLCKDEGLELMSLKSVAELDPVQDLLGDLGLSATTLLTSMEKVTNGGTNWLGDLASALLPPKDPSKDGDCLGLSALGLAGISCDMVSNFVCQVPDPPGTKTTVKTATKKLLTTFATTDATEMPTEKETTAVPDTTEATTSLYETTEAIPSSTPIPTASTKTTTSTTTRTTPTTTTSTSIVPLTTSTTSTQVTTTITSTSTSTSTSTATTTTTTTPIPCIFDCADFDKFLTSPTVAPNIYDGSVQTATSCNNRNYYISSITVSRDEAGLRCKAMNMTLLAVTSLEEINCLASVKEGIFWTSGSNVHPLCEPKLLYTWCSTGVNISSTLITNGAFWFPTTATVTPIERCLAVTTSLNAGKGMLHKNCSETLPFICQNNVECPKQCTKNTSLFDPIGNLINAHFYGFWIDIGNFTYLLGNQPMTWLESFLQCCALGMEPLNIENVAEQQGLTSITDVFKYNWPANFNYWTSATWMGSPAGQWSVCKPTGSAMFPSGLNWEKSQPDNLGGNESCVHFRFILNATGTILTDRNCTNHYVYACKSQLKALPKPCKVSCPSGACQRATKLFDSTGMLIGFSKYGNWYQGCGRFFLSYLTSPATWSVARDKCCEIGLTLASMESVGKLNCFSRIASKIGLEINGDFWLSGTDQGCLSKFHWCSLSRDFTYPELKWKIDHPVQGMNCVYLEVRNGSAMLATGNCVGQKNFLCEIRKKGTFREAMNTECAEIWDVSPAQIDLLLNASAFLSAKISINLKCFIKCVAVEVGMFFHGRPVSIETLRQIELISQENPAKLEQALAVYDQCRGLKFDDDCVTAYEIYKCCQERAPSLVSEIIINNYDNGSILTPPIGCVSVRRSCWLSDNFPCVFNETAWDNLNKARTDSLGQLVMLQNRLLYVGFMNLIGNHDPIQIFKHCCALGMKLMEPESLEDLNWAASQSGSAFDLFVGETEFINGTHEVWCNSSKIIPSSFYDTLKAPIYPCVESLALLSPVTQKLYMKTLPDGNIIDSFLNPQNYNPLKASGIYSFICANL